MVDQTSLSPQSRREPAGDLTRRAFLQSGIAVACIGLGLRARSTRGAEGGPEDASRVMTVRGPVPAGELGLALPHEHVVVDFLGAEKAAGRRYDVEAAVELALPHLRALKERGCRTLVECTPSYIGRDATLLLRLAKESGLHILTNTGYYGALDNKFLPRHAFEESSAELAKRWIAEWERGIDDTGIKPGFLKLGTGSGKLSDLHQKLLRAAAEVHLATGLTIAVHTGDGAAALDEIRILHESGVAPSALIWVHAQNDPGPIQLEAAKQGAWVSLDGYSLAQGNPERYVKMILALREANCLGRVLLSHDDGWSVEGDARRGAPLKLFGNGNPTPYRSVFDRLLPDLKREGLADAELHQLTVKNPADALAIRPRKR
jgi:phosphotriesterase-related protein